MNSDDSTYPGSIGFRAAGTGLPYGRSCLPCKGYGLQQTGGGVHRFMGVRTWHCAACNAKWHARRARAAEAVGGHAK